ncbi:restriction endonuclease subunit S [Streptomyces sp. MH13]|uniref:restriction endonuclease subunit S n=1 Tax=Streptomyces sp. MH13 TaxID=3417651 RepID=UPI003CF0E491
MRYRVKDIARINARTLPEGAPANFSFRYIDIGAVDGLGNIDIPTESIVFGKAPSRARRLAPAGSVIVSTVRTYLKAIASVPNTGERLVFSTGFAVLEAMRKVDQRYLAYYCQSQPFVEEVAARSTGVSYPAINASEIGNLPISLPPLDEQRRIAEFLDSETAQIDRLMEARERQARVFVEKLRAAAMGQTGRMEFHGCGPRHTVDVVPLRRAVSAVQTGSTPAGLLDSADGTADGLPWYTPAAMNEALTLGAAEKFVQPGRAGVPVFKPGSILFAGIGESLGKVAYLHHEATGNQQITAILPLASVSGEFLAWQLWAARDEIREWAQYSRIRIINNDSLKSFPIYLPSRTEQDSVACALGEMRNFSDRFNALSLKFRSAMADRRLALITAAVTGQLDVTTARPAHDRDL